MKVTKGKRSDALVLIQQAERSLSILLARGSMLLVGALFAHPSYAISPSTILGNVDGVFEDGSGAVVVRGWTCWKQWPGVSPSVDVYVGAESGMGGVKIGTYEATQPNEPAVDRACETTKTPHRFIITLNISIRQQYGGKALYLYGVPYVGFNNYTLLSGSGQFTVPAAPAVTDSIYYIQTDRLGSNVIMTDADANIVTKTDYKAYGAAADDQQKNEAPGYTGHYEDPLTGLTYMQQRYYDANLGRFISADPMTSDAGDVFNFNRYAYANNNPLVFVDPDGQKTLPAVRVTFYNDGGSSGGVSFGGGGGGGARGGTWGRQPHNTLEEVKVTADRPADPIVPLDAIRIAQPWYCTPGAASVAGATAGGVVAGGLTGMVDLRGNPYGIAVGAATGGVLGGTAAGLGNQIAPYIGGNAAGMIFSTLSSALVDHNSASAAVNGFASYVGSVLGVQPGLAFKIISLSTPYTVGAWVGTAPVLGKGSLVAAPMIGLAGGTTHLAVEAGWNSYCGN